MTALVFTALAVLLVAGPLLLALTHHRQENPMPEQPEPPVTKYKFTAVIRGNTHAEIVDELVSLTRGGYLLASDYEKRDEFDSYGGRDHITLEHTNPDHCPARPGVGLVERRPPVPEPPEPVFFRYVPDLQPAPSYADAGDTVHVITTLGGTDQ